MKKKEEKPKSKVKITHIMADGTRRDSVKGYPVPYNEKTAVAYDILVNMILGRDY